MFLLKRQGGITHRSLNLLKQFYNDLYGCFMRSRGALFNLADILLTETTAHSVIELSLLSYFERKWSTLYAALQISRLNQPRFKQTLSKFASKPGFGQRLVLAVDVTNMEGLLVRLGGLRLLVFA